MVPRNPRVLTIVGLIVAVALAAYGADKRTKLKPGFNILKPKDDVEIGRQSVREAERQLQILNDVPATTYIRTLGKNLATYAPNNDPVYIFEFKNVDRIVVRGVCGKVLAKCPDVRRRRDVIQYLKLPFGFSNRLPTDFYVVFWFEDIEPWFQLCPLVGPVCRERNRHDQP